MVHVLKADGTLEEFSEQKLLHSIQRAGIPKELEQQVIKQVSESLYESIPTYDIYNVITTALGKSKEPYSKGRYSLKQSIMMLGPTGYPFEDFMGIVLSEHGYKVQTRQILNGRCITHEVDVIAEKGDKKILVEAKFHNNPGTRSDVQVPLYVKARFDDVKDRYGFTDAWVVTNTKTTIDANGYAECSGMGIISWNFPEKGSLRDLVEEKSLHPITMLTTLSNQHKAQLLANHIILCKDLLTKKNALAAIDLSHEEREKTLAEARYICTTSHHHIS